MSNHVLISLQHRQGRRWSAFTRRTAASHLQALGLSDCELSISLVSDARIRILNREWRKKDRATDVLSFPLDADEAPGPRLLGDIIVSLDTTRRQAKERGVAFGDELARYLAHGLLHLLGHDHHLPGPRRKMAALEKKLLGQPGLIPTGRYARSST